MVADGVGSVWQNLEHAYVYQWTWMVFRLIIYYDDDIKIANQVKQKIDNGYIMD